MVTTTQHQPGRPREFMPLQRSDDSCFFAESSTPLAGMVLRGDPPKFCLRAAARNNGCRSSGVRHAGNCARAAAHGVQARVRRRALARLPKMPCNLFTAIMAGSRARGRRSVAVWLTSSAVSVWITTNRLRSSPLEQSLPMRRTLQTFRHRCPVVCVKSHTSKKMSRKCFDFCTKSNLKTRICTTPCTHCFDVSQQHCTMFVLITNTAVCWDQFFPRAHRKIVVDL